MSYPLLPPLVYISRKLESEAERVSNPGPPVWDAGVPSRVLNTAPKLPLLFPFVLYAVFVGIYFEIR